MILSYLDLFDDSSATAGIALKVCWFSLYKREKNGENSTIVLKFFPDFLEYLNSK